ncbi:1,4-dihydroxy-2-naphthoyl-CoA hydrolase [Xanthomonas hortorum pv. pelargonii]|uniref:1,4-dihydroxy-2-naphthoyl-CoA hydrolase n=2 Tax=Xanthomonas hortorum pv. pelargonii TaxID=453602 RepID=A0A6V7BHJ9_9XANT|nr:1,4-dihydroxy-2-naphthoyl-CoA hydrolase [Xanthomonas hortorum pv. pelargonii]CAD0300890.1 1,4-dihydroxy-2-naphthoyl-CoA hydrolase [Xanthomonas hortorum pv. pelargonii]
MHPASAWRTQPTTQEAVARIHCHPASRQAVEPRPHALNPFPIPNPQPMTFRDPVDLAALNASSRDTLIEHLGIVFTDAGEDWLRATMPVDSRTKQPYGLLHGGASVVLAETLGSSAGNLCVDMTTQMCVGLEINANHLRAAYQDVVTGTARAVHIGRSTQVWDIIIENPAGKRVCVSRLTLAVVSRSNG